MTPTAKQSAASRANGQKSHGPTTAAGKAKSQFNALKHGIHAETQIMFDETAEDLAHLTAEYYEKHSPADADQRFLVDTLIHNEWRLRRMRRVEAALWEHAANIFSADHPQRGACNSAQAFVAAAPTFERLQRVVNSCERNYHRALKQLSALQAEAMQALQPDEAEATSETPGSFRTNSQSAPNPLPPAPETLVNTAPTLAEAA